MKEKNPLTCLVALGLALSIGAAVYGQIYTGTIAGRVADQTGGVLPGVTVTLSSDVLIQSQTAVTSATGSYRFAELPIGTYTLTFELAGFQKVIRENIILTAGATQTINIELGLAEVAETVTVSGESPVVDVRQTGVPESFDNERLENIPTARDPWVILEQTPGVVVDRQNVGGNESGQQSIFAVRGDNGEMVTYNYDGINITDEASLSSPMYYDFGAFEEIQINTGGNDPSMQTGGAQINFLIKQGTNRWSGQGSFYGTNDDLQGDNVSDELRAQGAGAGAPIKKILDYGFDIGGPILRDHLWIWGDYGVQDIHKGAVGFLIPGCTDPNDAACLNDDPTKLKNNNLKVNFQPSPNNKFNFLWARNEKTRATRGAGPRRPLETTWMQGGPTNIYKFEDTHIASDNLLFTGRYAYVGGGFFLHRQSPDLRNVQVAYEYNTRAYSRSYYEYDTSRPQHVFNFDGNYFLANALGGDHEWKFGFQYKRASIDSASNYGGDVIAAFEGGEAVEAWLFRPALRAYEGKYASAYVQDVYTRGRVTFKAGLRFDWQTGNNVSSQVPGNMIVPDFMPALDFPGTEQIDPWKNVSPRAGFTYDLTGDGKTIVRGNYSRYYDKLRLGSIVTWNNPVNISEVDVPWTDLNGDRFVQADEIDTSTFLYIYNFDPGNPTSVDSPNILDPGLSPGTVDEIIVGAEREVIPDFSVGANYIYKRFGNMLWDDWAYPSDGLAGIQQPYVGVTSADFVPTAVEFEGQTLTYYELPFDRPAETLLTNWPDYHQRYQGIEIYAKKRLSRRWMLTGAFNFNDHREYFGGDAGIFDPTNIDLRDGGQVFTATGGSGKSDIFLNSRWGFHFDGMVQLPGGINVAGKFNGRQGFTLPKTYRSPSREGGLGRAEVLLNPIGDDRIDNLWYADMRVEKRFGLGGEAELTGMVDIFNLLNQATVLGRERVQNTTTANNVLDLLSARVVRFGVRFRF